MRRIYWQLTNPGYLELLPRLRLTIGPDVGLGFAWIQAWLHVWLWKWPVTCRMVELLPRIWFFRSEFGCYMHLEWIVFKWTRLIYSGKGKRDE